MTDFQLGIVAGAGGFAGLVSVFLWFVAFLDNRYAPAEHGHDTELSPAIGFRGSESSWDDDEDWEEEPANRGKK